MVSLDSGINDRKAIVAIKDSIQNNLEDPRAQYTADSRSWVHTDNPLTSATYPRIQVRKRGPTTTRIISIGENFIEWRIMILDVQIWSKIPFKWKDSTNEYLQDEEFIKEYLDKIWKTLKAQQSTLKSSYGITGLKPIEEEPPKMVDGRQMYTGIIPIRLWYFRR